MQGVHSSSSGNHDGGSKHGPDSSNGSSSGSSSSSSHAGSKYFPSLFSTTRSVPTTPSKRKDPKPVAKVEFSSHLDATVVTVSFPVFVIVISKGRLTYALRGCAFAHLFLRLHVCLFLSFFLASWLCIIAWTIAPPTAAAAKAASHGQYG